MQTYEFIVVTADGQMQRIIADNIKGVLEAVDEDTSPIINIFRNTSVTEGGKYASATVTAEAYPPPAVLTGCKAYPMFPVQTKQGEAVVLSASASAGWKLEGWYLKEKLVGTATQLTVIAEDAGENIYTARFIPAV